ncbi:MAG TPA: YceK/YidQ family lipoprotein, partial [Candidatus Handelsmanbacteria bacterium]|nr:YceK/YidQ family lipoprotein [Candidatus Handelsmanbacteria bacterium]
RGREDLFLLDLPVSAAMDTVLLPIAIFVEPKRPPNCFAHGCEWAAKR